MKKLLIFSFVFLFLINFVFAFSNDEKNSACAGLNFDNFQCVEFWQLIETNSTTQINSIEQIIYNNTILLNNTIVEKEIFNNTIIEIHQVNVTEKDRLDHDLKMYELKLKYDNPQIINNITNVFINNDTSQFMTIDKFDQEMIDLNMRISLLNKKKELNFMEYLNDNIIIIVLFIVGLVGLFLYFNNKMSSGDLEVLDHNPRVLKRNSVVKEDIVKDENSSREV